MTSDVNRGNRPRSPHVMIYRPQLTSILSIVHRITGVGMSVTALLIVWWFIAAATGADTFDIADSVLTSWLGILVLVASLWAFWFHFFNGIRHLRWDTGAGMGIDETTRSGIIALALSVVMTILCIVLAL